MEKQNRLYRRSPHAGLSCDMNEAQIFIRPERPQDRNRIHTLIIPHNDIPTLIEDLQHAYDLQEEQRKVHAHAVTS